MSAVLEVRQLSRRFGGLVAVDALSFDLQPGEILGLIGPNGAGKTTVFNLLMGLLRPDQGSIRLGGESLLGLRPSAVCRRGMVKTFQNVALFPEMSVLDNVLAAALLREDLSSARALARRNLERVGLGGIEDKLAGSLSFPERARVELARALCTQPRVVLLDEVMAALNDVEMDAVLALVRQLAREEGLSFVVIEHHMRAIMSLCDRIVVLCFGQKIAEGRPEDVARDPRVIDAYLGSGAHAAEPAGADAESHP